MNTCNNLKKAMRISFSNLRNADSQKQNKLSFQNLKQTCRPQDACIPHQKQNMFQQNRTSFTEFNASNSPLLSQSKVKKNAKNSSVQLSRVDFTEEQYKRAQNKIKLQIEEYNSVFGEIIQALTDMQIKDLMKFNQILDNNQKIYYEAEIAVASFACIPQEDFLKIFEVKKKVVAALNQSLKSFDFRSTFESKDKKTVILSEVIKNKKSRAIQNSIQDTPQSVKSKLSCVSTKIKPEKNHKIEMFDRINICESIDEGTIQHFNGMKETKGHRYGRSVEQ